MTFLIDKLVPLQGGSVRSFGDGAGENWMDEHSGRCGRCDSRYCYNGCFAGEFGYVFCTGRGYITEHQARAQEIKWAAAGIEFGRNHLRRIDWQTSPTYEQSKEPEQINISA